MDRKFDDLGPKYVEYFGELWKQLSTNDFAKRFALILEKQTQYLNVKLRIDAKCFLLINFKDMICRAIREYSDEFLSRDIYLILKNAMKKMKTGHHISAHSLLISVRDVWNLLHFTDFWG